MKVSILIVYFKGWHDFKKCLLSIKNQKSRYSFEVIVINNGKEGIKSKVANILAYARYIKNKENKGYGFGNNVGAQKAKGEYLFVLNPDVELHHNTIDTLVSYLDTHSNVAVVAPNLLYPNGKTYKLIGTRELTPLSGLVSHSFLNKLFPTNPISINYFLLDTSFRKTRQSFSVPGCAFMIRKKVFEEVGKFDENIFLYYEESDLGKRIQDAKYDIFILPAAKVIHNHSFDSDPALKKYNAQSRFYYFKKYYGIFWALVVEVFCRFGKRHAIALGVIAFIGILLIVST